jgi:hypothetical protein
MSAYTILLDAPDQPVAKVQIAKLGDDFEHGRYGKFSITASEVGDWKRNLSQLPGGRALIDEDHMADKPSPHRRTQASGWITDVALERGVPMATVEWTPRGEAAIRNREYLFLSPAFGPYKNEKGEQFDNTLMGAAMTNKPHLNMPAISLASDDRVRAAREREHGAKTLFADLPAVAALTDRTLGDGMVKAICRDTGMDYLKALDTYQTVLEEHPGSPAMTVGQALELIPGLKEGGRGVTRMLDQDVSPPSVQAGNDRAIRLDQEAQKIMRESKVNYMVALHTAEEETQIQLDAIGAGKLEYRER